MKNPLIPEDSPFLAHDTRKSRWAIPYHSECLNARLEVLLTQNQKFINGKKVLDVGSHMGTFAYAALQSGADFIHGIDSEKKMIALGKNLFQEIDVAKESYSMEVCDALQYLESIEEKSFDTVFCLGITQAHATSSKRNRYTRYFHSQLRCHPRKRCSSGL